MKNSSSKFRGAIFFCSLICLTAFRFFAFSQCPIELTLQPGSSEGIDAVVSGNPAEVNINWGSHPDLFAVAWTAGGQPATGRGLFKFDLSPIPANATVLQATLYLYNNPNSGNGNPAGQHSQLSGSNAAWLQKITAPWNEYTVTWNFQPPSSTTNQVVVPASTSGHQDYVIPVAGLIQDLVSNPATNYG